MSSTDSTVTKSFLYGTTLRLDHDGALLAGLRDKAGAALYRSLDGAEWTQLGDTMGEITDVAMLAHGGTRLALGIPWHFRSFTPPEESGPVDHATGVLELIAVDGSTEVLAEAPLVNLAEVQLSPDGRCAAYLRSDGDVLRFVDVERKRSFDLFPTDPPFNGESSLSLVGSTWVTGR